jgi:GntR family transcriptional regulator / MocR family aminotransferase
MQRSWTTSGRALHLDLPSGPSRRAAIERALRDAICCGSLRLGAPLPSSRALAQDLGVARGTVVEIYGQLTAEGYLESRQGSGTVVAWAGRTAPRTPALPPAPDPVRFSFRSGSPDVSSFPRAAWVRALRAALARAPDLALDYGDARGRPELRAALADYLGRARGVVVAEEDLVICNGFGHGIWLLARALRDAGAGQVALEDPGSEAARFAFQDAGVRWRPLPVDGEGLRVDLLTPRDRAVVLTPAHQYPLGVTLSPARRSALVAWARAHDGLVIEDDYDGEFRYDRQPVGALQALDPARVAYAGTASKALAPGLRLGWLALPRRWVAPVAGARRSIEGQSAVPDQLALAELVRSGAFERHLRRMRREYRRRRDTLLAALAARAPALAAEGIAAGLHLLLRLPAGASEEALEAAARERGVYVSGLRNFTTGEAPSPGGLVIGYGRPPANGYQAAVAALTEALSDAFPPARPRRGAARPARPPQAPAPRAAERR